MSNFIPSYSQHEATHMLLINVSGYVYFCFLELCVHMYVNWLMSACCSNPIQHESCS